MKGGFLGFWVLRFGVFGWDEGSVWPVTRQGRAEKGNTTTTHIRQSLRGERLEAAARALAECLDEIGPRVGAPLPQGVDQVGQLLQKPTHVCVYAVKREGGDVSGCEERQKGHAADQSRSSLSRDSPKRQQTIPQKKKKKAHLVVEAQELGQRQLP